jgi:hypothetical protein
LHALLELEVADVSVEYIELSPDGLAGAGEVIVVEHDLEPQVEASAPEAEQAKHLSIYTY